MNRALGISVFLAVLAGCNQPRIGAFPPVERAGVPDLVVEPAHLDFGERRAEEDTIRKVTLTNISQAPVDVSELRLSSGDAFRVLGDTAFRVNAESSVEVEIAFTPLDPDENVGELIVVSDDPDSPEIPVSLSGFGMLPSLEISPVYHVFGDAFVPCGASVDVDLKNVGHETLVIDDFAYESVGFLSMDDRGLRDALPLSLEPGDVRTVRVDFAAATTAADNGTLTVFSNDPRGQRQADQNGEAVHADIRSQTDVDEAITSVDVMFLIDQSCSMDEDNQDDIDNGTPAFIQELESLADWQLLQVTAEDGCGNGGVLDAETQDVADIFVDNAFATPTHSETEALLELAAVALDETESGGCNEGFMRPGSLLHIIVASDEEEQSGVSHMDWLQEYAAFAGGQEFVRVSAVVDRETQCGDGTGAGGYLDAAMSTGGVVLDICNAQWGEQMDDLAASIVSDVHTIKLDAPADPMSLEVLVNGQPAVTYSFNEEANTVVITEPLVADGDVVDVTYGVLSDCG